ncbi:MAG: thiolase family protein [Planctomycetota bacterium]|nr:thiolase family protein [Planctomycetota bacterium]
MTKKRRVVVVEGRRTPFTKAFSELRKLDTIELASAACKGLIEESKIDPREIDEVIWGSVIFKSSAPNTARELVLDLNLPPSIPGMTVTRACLSGLQAITHAAAVIERGDADVMIAGGSDSCSNAEVPLPTNLTLAMGKLTFGGKLNTKKVLGALTELESPKDLLPSAPKIAERSTGRTMGQHADEMAEKNGVSREEQDAFAIASHKKAHQAWKSGRFDSEITSIDLGGHKLSRDTLVRQTVDPAKLAKLRAVFRKEGTITAATSSPLTDGASAVLLMSEEKAKELGFKADVELVDWTYCALDPFDQLLIGPALAIPKLLEKHNLTLEDIDVFEIHEAFAAQVLSVLKALASDEFCKARFGRDKAWGEIPEEKVNPHGGSVAIGHPFAATGGRLVTTAANELRRTGKKRAIVTLCAGGAMGGAALLETISD